MTILSDSLTHVYRHYKVVHEILPGDCVVDLGLTNRVALVAVASKGIGYACAYELAREGAPVFLCSRDEKRASEAAEKIHQETGGAVAGIGADVTDKEAVGSLVNIAYKRAGRVDVFVTNAGGPPAGVHHQIDLDLFRKAFECRVRSLL